MAFVGSTPEEEQKNNQGQPGQNPLSQQAPVSTSSAPGAGPGAAPASSASGAVASNQASPQPFTNLQAYLTANAPQIEGMGGQIAGKINEGYGKVQNDITAGTEGFKNQVSGGYAAPNADVVNQATSNPTQFVSDPNNVKAFQAQLNNQYTGPSNFEGSDYYANLNKEVQDAAGKANLVNTPSGMQTYLQGIEQNPTAGDTTLDQVLLYGSPTALNTVKGAASQAAGLPDYLSSVIPGQNQSVQDAIAAANASREAARGKLSETGTNFASDLQKRVDEAQKNYSLYNQDVGQLRGTAQDINSQIQAYLAANPNLKLDRSNNYLQPWMDLGEATNAPNAGNVAGAGDYATQAALAQLAGDSGLFNGPLDQSGASQAGTFGLPLDLQTAIANKDIPASMQKELEALSGQITGAYKPYESLMNQEMARSNLVTQTQQLQTQLEQLNQNLKSGTMTDAGGVVPMTDQQKADTQKQIQDIQQQIQTNMQDPNYQTNSYWDQIAQMGQGIQWLGPASTGYNDLISKLQADLQGLGGMNVPQAPAPAVPSTVPQEAGNAASTAIGVGAPVAAATGLTAAPAIADSVTAMAGPEALDSLGLSAGQTIGPAALAAYGTSNIAQNMAANPVQNSLATLANTGLSLATLSLPPKILDSLGKNLQNVLNNIGNFFKGLF